jgi:hypothetical protein
MTIEIPVYLTKEEIRVMKVACGHAFLNQKIPLALSPEDTGILREVLVKLTTAK